MALSELIEALRTDLADPQGDLFSGDALSRCLLRSVFTLARDLGQPFAIVGSEIQPEPQGEARELLLLLAQIGACQVMRAATANSFSFSSGDKRVDKSGQSASWGKLENDLQATYRARLAVLRPEVAASENYIITPDLQPVIFEQGSRGCRDAH